MLDLSRSPLEMAGPLQPPLGSVRFIKPGVKLKGSAEFLFPSPARGKPGQLCTSAHWEGQEITKNERQPLGKLDTLMKDGKALKGTCYKGACLAAPLL